MEGFNGEGLWIFALLILLFGGGGFGGFGNNRFGYDNASQEILFGQQFQGLDNKIDRIGYGIADSGYANAQLINGVQMQLANCCCENQRNTDSLRYDVSRMFCETNANTNAQTQKILDAMAQNKIDSLQAQVSDLKTQNMMCGIPRINPYYWGVYPYPVPAATTTTPVATA